MIEYEDNAKFAQDVQAVLGNKSYVEFNDLREQEIKVVALVCIRTTEEGEPKEYTGNPVICKKLSPVVKLLTKADYLIIGDHYCWEHADDAKKNAAIHRALSAISVERNKKGGIVLKLKKPPIQEWPATIARFGPWNESLLDMREAFKVSAKHFAENQKAKG